MRGYRLLTYSERGGSPAAGVLVGDRIHPTAKILAGVPGLHDPSSVFCLLQCWDRVHSVLRETAGRLSGGTPLAEVTLCAPILSPGELFCAGANYWDHLSEMADIAERTTGKRPSMTKGAEPWFFLKNARSGVIGSNSDVRLPSFSKQVDWEAELAVIIGQETRNISVERALDAVAGYTILNDVTMRDWQFRTSQFLQGKTFERSTPVGPYLVTPDEVDHARELRLCCSVDGRPVQDASTSDMLFSVGTILSYISSVITLMPGDLVATGTPAGVGAARKPPEYLTAGQTLESCIEGLGGQRNLCRAPADRHQR